METLSQIDSTVDRIIHSCGPDIVLATALGLGKPGRLLNALYARVKAEPQQLSLTIYTALSLAIPKGKQDLEQRFLQPFTQRHFGPDYPELSYLHDMNSGRLPSNIRVHEFYFSSGSQLNNALAQRSYISQNYTHVARDLAAAGVNVLLQQVAQRGEAYSLSSNPDVALDLLERMQQQGKKLLVVGVINPALPFLGGDAQVAAELFDLMLDERRLQRLFPVPRETVSLVEHALGLHASTLVKDGGTLQIGIGALSDAIVNALLLRQHNNARYLQAVDALEPDANERELVARWGGLTRFQQGLYGATEMVMDGFMHLRRAGILKREVFDDLPLQTLLNSGALANPLRADTLDVLLQQGCISAPLSAKDLSWLQHFGFIDDEADIGVHEISLKNGKRLARDPASAEQKQDWSQYLNARCLQHGRYLEGAFYLGSKDLYQWLHELQGADWSGLAMQRVSHINELYGGRETLDRAQRREARFFNTCMMQTLLGAAVSDALDNAQVVSGVGGQYNFVAMAHALSDGRSILLLRATRTVRGNTQSNIVWNYGHTTIPRHLRDIVISEYGIADLRGQADSEVIKRLTAISDARFQDELMAQAKAAGKLEATFTIPPAWRQNTPEYLQRALAPFQHSAEFGEFPFGSDFDTTEQRLLTALRLLKSRSSTPAGKLLMLLHCALPLGSARNEDDCLQRMGLQAPQGFKQQLQARMLRLALQRY